MANENHVIPVPRIDAAAIAARLETLAYADLCPSCEREVIAVAADTTRLLIEVIRLHDALYLARLESGNRLAAIRATLGAAADHEPDPLAYLRDELPDESPGNGGEWCR